MSNSLVFFGTEAFSLTSLQALVEAGYPVAAVITKPDQPKGRGHTLTAPAVKTYAKKHGIRVWQPKRLLDIAEDLKTLLPATGVLSSYGMIIPQSIIELFSPGIINIHPSLLPAYRGPTPIESAIMHGDPETGISIMQLSAKMDAGPVYHQVKYVLTGTETQPELYQTLGTLGAQTLVDILPSILDRSLQAEPQNDQQATYCQLLTKQDAWLSPQKVSAKQAERKVRAHLSFPKTKLSIQEHPIIIKKAHVANHQKSPLDISCQTGILAIDELVAPSGKSMDAAAFLRGYLSV